MYPPAETVDSIERHFTVLGPVTTTYTIGSMEVDHLFTEKYCKATTLMLLCTQCSEEKIDMNSNNHNL